jgi:predicted lysophospholipase L1 biosynthesis ABC-type transport system permease subunit
MISIQEFMTVEFLATFTGCMVMTSIILQVLKSSLDGLLPRARVSSKLWALLISYAILLIVDAVLGALTPDSATLALLNAFVVANATTGTYDFYKRVFLPKEQEEE